MAYRRVVLKLSGEAMGRPKVGGLDGAAVEFAARQILEAAAAGAELGVVVGGGNFIRGGGAGGTAFSRVAADQMGMLATVINAMALRDVIRRLGGVAEVRAAVPVPGVVEQFRAEEVRDLMAAGAVVCLAGGTGNPFFTTDTACALRCCELEADLMLKATKVDGVYSADPVTNPGARRFDRLSYDEVLDKKLGVMDLTAVELLRSRKVAILVFDFLREGNIVRAVKGEKVGTVIS